MYYLYRGSLCANQVTEAYTFNWQSYPWAVRRRWITSTGIFELVRDSPFEGEYFAAYSNESVRIVIEDRIYNAAYAKLVQELNIGILHGQIIDTAIERSISDIIHSRYSELFESNDRSLVQRTVFRSIRRIESKFPGLYDAHRELCIGRALIADIASAFEVRWTAADIQSISHPMTLDHIRQRAAVYLERDPECEHGKKQQQQISMT
jgi:hypothetical protein